ncbi:MAG: ABC-2 family transporter protein [Myxococcales bacterium]|nr:ABC-2 family transporter protein [Myxococcales bacterium]
MARHLAIALFLARASIQTQAQYRVDFLVQTVLALFWVVWNVAPLWLVFEIRPEVAGWTRPQAMLVMSAFLILKAVLEGLITPNLVALVDRIRTGTLDFLLLKPADAQLMVSFTKVVPAKTMDLLAGLAMAAASIAQLDPAPTPTAVLAGAAMLGAGALVLYAVWILVACVAFWVVKIDNLSFLFTSLFDAARWPVSVFRGWVRVVLTWVLPIAAMTSYPALAVLERLDLVHAVWAWGLTLGLLVGSRLAWRQAVLHYSSASS